MNDEHFKLPKEEYDPEGVGLIKTLGFFLEVKVYGDWQNPLEDSLLMKFKKQITSLVLGDGRTRCKVSMLEEMYDTRGSDFDGLASIAQRRIREKGVKPVPKRKVKKVANPMFKEAKKSIQFSTKDNISEHPEEDII